MYGAKSVKIVGSIKTIENRMFSSCVALENVTIPEGVIEIGDSAFSFCNSLKTITIPNSVKKIGILSFNDCTSLDIKIPDSVEEIKSGAFDNVKHIEYHGKAKGAPWGAKSMN